MHMLMNIQTALLTEYLITYITNIRALTIMHAIMCYQIPLLLNAYFTALWALITVYVFVVYQITHDCMPYYTHHKHKGTHHYACNDVLSDSSFTECLLHSSMGAHHCVFVVYQTTPVTVCLITHITNIRALSTVYAFMC